MQSGQHHAIESGPLRAFPTRGNINNQDRGKIGEALLLIMLVWAAGFVNLP
jgi:hypothetical protein